MTMPLTNTAATINRYTKLNLKHDGNGFHAVRTLAFGGGGVIGVFAPAYEQVKLAESRQRPEEVVHLIGMAAHLNGLSQSIHLWNMEYRIHADRICDYNDAYMNIFGTCI